MIISDLATCLQPYIERMAKAQSEFASKEQFKPFFGELFRDIQQAFGPIQPSDIPEAASQIDTSVNIEIADNAILA